MKSSQTIYNPEFKTVTISLKEYNKLIQYKELALEMKKVLNDEH